MQRQPQVRPLRPGLSDHLAAWGLDPALAIALVVLPLLIMGIAVWAAIASPAAFIAITEEDTLVEWLQVLALAIAGVVFLVVAYRGRQMGGRLVPFVHLVIGAGSLVVAGEEISWGQRIFGWSTPPLFENINYQQETNIHNTFALESVMKLTEIGAGAYGTLLPVIAVTRWAPQVLRSSLLVPPIALISFFLITFVHWTSRIFIDPSRPIARLSEVAELALFTGGALFALLCLRRLASEVRRLARNAGPVRTVARTTRTDLGRGRA